jgi:predicted membrane-bound mannosyltransferase
MVFYSRYFIHEMLLVFFTLLALASGWRYVETRRARWAALTGVGLGLMYATKETFVFSVVAMGLAAAATVWWNRWRAQRSALVSERIASQRPSPFSLRPLIARATGSTSRCVDRRGAGFACFVQFVLHESDRPD